ncbi:cell division ABC transporter subunit FtsX [Martelella mediterranea DSM 17316]|uniref:Cell division ABC transporter subunit FtsX n=2 Tax=Aurantimonadaceae TaxID=255475 RepID=A0A1U9Z1H1_9HYPH|nr:cell division ABC transporter subunit FtsX [Martelella mediterranea DSM 17316]
MTRPPRSLRDPRIEERERAERRLAEQRAEEERLLEARRLEEIRQQQEEVARRQAEQQRQLAQRRAEELEKRRAKEREAARQQETRRVEAERAEEARRAAQARQKATSPTPAFRSRANPVPQGQETPVARRAEPSRPGAAPSSEPTSTKARTPRPAPGSKSGGKTRFQPARQAPRKPTPIVPPSNVQTRALMAVVTIMAFLACLTLGAVSMVRATAESWQGGISREVTIQIKPREGRDMNQALLNARDVALQFVGTLDGRVVDEAATERLLEPWLGTGLDFDMLPVPRLVIVTIDENNPPDFTAMAAALQKAVPGASLDDHRAWVSRLSAMADATTTIGVSIMALVFSAMVLTVVFATRGALAGSRDIVEVLHFVGAEASFVARQFQRHFLNVALKGAFLGGALACLFFVLARFWQRRYLATPGADQTTALFGTISIGWGAYFGILLTIVAIAGLTALTTRLTVIRTIREIDIVRSDPERSDTG